MVSYNNLQKMEQARDNLYFEKKQSQRLEKNSKSRGYTPVKTDEPEESYGSVKKITQQLDQTTLEDSHDSPNHTEEDQPIQPSTEAFAPSTEEIPTPCDE